MKKLCIFVFSFVMIFNLSAKEHNFSVGASFGLLTGQAQEIVYMDTNYDNKLSELLWNFKSLPYIGLDIKYSWLKPENVWGLFANGSFKYGLSSKPDVMEDRDWLAEEIKNINNPNWLTNYSVHNNKTESAILMDFNLGASFLIFQKFLLKPYISYHYMHFSWTASGGSMLFPTWRTGWDHAYIPEDINVVTYEQTWYIFSPAISFYGEFNRFFDIEIAFEATPFIWCIAKDEHLSNNKVHTVFNDYVKEGVFIEPSLLFSYKPIDHFVLSLSFIYRDINKSRGDTLIKEPSSSTYILNQNKGGAGYTAFDIGIIAKYKL